VAGRKITSFRNSILYLDKSRKVTVDGHMICIAVEKNLTMSQANFIMRDRFLYDDIEQPVLDIAKASGMAPCAVQASLWTWRKRTLGIKFNPQTDLFTGRTRWDAIVDPTEVFPYPKGFIPLFPGPLEEEGQLTLW
jgi:hypothetical protein